MFYALENLYNDCELHEYKKENIGENQPDASYLNHPEWHKVYSGAKKLFDLMDANDKKYNFNEEYEEYYKLQFPNYGKEQ